MARDEGMDINKHSKGVFWLAKCSQQPAGAEQQQGVLGTAAPSAQQPPHSLPHAPPGAVLPASKPDASALTSPVPASSAAVRCSNSWRSCSSAARCAARSARVTCRASGVDRNVPGIRLFPGIARKSAGEGQARAASALQVGAPRARDVHHRPLQLHLPPSTLAPPALHAPARYAPFLPPCSPAVQPATSTGDREAGSEHTFWCVPSTASGRPACITLRAARQWP